jgi:hypothetical protein
MPNIQLVQPALEVEQDVHLLTSPFPRRSRRPRAGRSSRCPLVDAHALSAPVKAGKSRQIATNGMTATSNGSWRFPGLMKYDFCLQRKAAKALDLTIPASVISIADHVVE